MDEQKKLMTGILLPCLLGLLLACNLRENAADTKHLSLLDEDAAYSPTVPGSKEGLFIIHKEDLLISRIYDPEWRWAYVIDEVCTKYPYTFNRYGDLNAVLAYVEKSIKMWLAPLKDTKTARVVPGGVLNRKVVNKFTAVDQSMYYERNRMSNGRPGLVRKAEPNEELDDYTFTIFFHCRGKGLISDRNAYARPYCDTCLPCVSSDAVAEGLVPILKPGAQATIQPVSWPKSINPEIHIFLPKRWRSFAGEFGAGKKQNENEFEEKNGKIVRVNPMLIGNSSVLRGDILHEIGHLFGNADTYFLGHPLNNYVPVGENGRPYRHSIDPEKKARDKAFKELGYDPYPPRSGAIGSPTNPITIADIRNPKGGGIDEKTGQYIGAFHPPSTMSCEYSLKTNPDPSVLDEKGEPKLAPDDIESIWDTYALAQGLGVFDD